MTKAMLILDEMPHSCRDCPFHRKDCEIHMGNYKYQNLYICPFMPEDVYYGGDDEEDELVDVYINKHMINQTKPEWCPLVEVKEGKR